MSSPFQLDLFRYVLGELGTDDLPDVALRAMMAGADSLMLAALAGAAPCEGPVERRFLFDRALAELGLALPTVREAVATMRDVRAAEVVAGTLSPVAAATAMHQLREALEWPEARAENAAGGDLGLGVFTSVYYTYDDCNEDWADPGMRLRLDAEVREECEAIVRAAQTKASG